MKRLTTNDASHILAPLNLFYVENKEVMIRGGGPEPDYADTTLVELVRRIAKTHDLSIAAESPESLGDELYDAMFDGVDTVEGVIALLHAAAIQAAEMRGRLEMIEDILGDEYDLTRLRERTQADREGRCVILPCKVGDAIYMPIGIRYGKITGYEEDVCDGFHIARDGVLQIKAKCYTGNHGTYGVPGKTAFIAREEAEAALKEAENEVQI